MFFYFPPIKRIRWVTSKQIKGFFKFQALIVFMILILICQAITVRQQIHIGNTIGKNEMPDKEHRILTCQGKRNVTENLLNLTAKRQYLILQIKTWCYLNMTYTLYPTYNFMQYVFIVLHAILHLKEVRPTD